MSEQLLRLGADLASFNNLEVGDALDKLRSGLTGEAEPLRELGVLLSEDAVQAEALASGLAESTKAITEADKVQARYNLILKQTATAQGDFARTSTGLANAQRIISAAGRTSAPPWGKPSCPRWPERRRSWPRRCPGPWPWWRTPRTLGPALAALFSGDLQGALDQALVLVGAVGERLGPRAGHLDGALLGLGAGGDPTAAGGPGGWPGTSGPWIGRRRPPSWRTWWASGRRPSSRGRGTRCPPCWWSWASCWGRSGSGCHHRHPGAAGVGPRHGRGAGEGDADGPGDGGAPGDREGIRVDVGGINVGVGLNPIDIARQVGQQVAAAVLASLTASALATDPGASTGLQGAGR